MLLYLQLAVLSLICFLYVYLGMGYDYFVSLPWWDVLLHVLGGIWLGFFYYWVNALFKIRSSLVYCIFFVFAVGIGWEVFERALHIGGSVFMSYRVDTIKDLLDDCMGGLLGAVVARNVRKKI